ncbi:MAG: hypothetical protein U5K37_01175 [Natrialbaceae archaeon]|nr:hypothetical protein [Natrialbaceae archaeon]
MYRRLYLATAAALTAGAAGCSAFAEDENGAPDNGSDNGPAEGRGPTYLRDDFEDLEAWDVIDGELSADTQRTVDGEQSALLESGIDSRAKITRSFPDPIDMDGQVPGLVVAAESRVAPMIHLVDANGNWIEYRQSIAGGTDFTPLNFGITRDSGEVDHSAITKIHITMWTGPTTNRLWIDDLHQTPGIEGWLCDDPVRGWLRARPRNWPAPTRPEVDSCGHIRPAGTAT